MDRRLFIGGLGTAIGMSALPAWGPAWAADDRQAQFETLTMQIDMGDEPPLPLSLKELMDAYAVPSVSIAMIDNYSIAWAKGYGVTEAGGATRTDASTLFQAASISKTATAVAAMSLVGEGKLSLDANVNDALKSWHLPDNDFTKVQKATLRRIMSHSAGLSVHGFAGYEAGAPLPSVPQILDGLPPANSPPVRVIVEPGTQEIYSGGGVIIEQLLMLEATGQAYPDILKARVLDPFGMTSSTYAQPLPAALTGRAASGTRMDGKAVPGKWHTYPEMAAAGLWTTPSDLAAFMIGVAKARSGQPAPISQAVATAMLTPQLAGGTFGLGFGLFPNNLPHFRHSGANDGFQCLMQIDWSTGKGVVAMTNSDNGMSVMAPIVGRLDGLYGLHGPTHPLRPMPDLTLIQRLRGVDALLKAFDRLYAADPKHISPALLNAIGYSLMMSGDMASAIRVLQRNADAFPQDGNSYDSLAEAYLKNGQNDLAIANYRKSLALDPSNDNARQQLKALGATP